MKHSNSELIVERYYRFKNWLVERNVPILPQTGKKNWSDLDILAVGDEVHLISCKDFLPSNKEIDKVINNLTESESYIKKEYKYLNDKEFKKIYIYGGTGKEALRKAKENGIETIEIKEIFFKYLKVLDDFLLEMNTNRKDIPVGKRFYIVGELEGLDKFISFLLNNNLLNDEMINKALNNLGKSDLSKPKIKLTAQKTMI
ncbi:MAG: hypothetical protein IPM26_08735 [Saprospiraceae bacterium]|nr:hypothetical protein [Saprospiraceae bacterium]